MSSVHPRLVSFSFSYLILANKRGTFLGCNNFNLFQLPVWGQYAAPAAGLSTTATCWESWTFRTTSTASSAASVETGFCKPASSGTPSFTAVLIMTGEFEGLPPGACSVQCEWKVWPLVFSEMGKSRVTFALLPSYSLFSNAIPTLLFWVECSVNFYIFRFSD